MKTEVLALSSIDIAYRCALLMAELCSKAELRFFFEGADCIVLLASPSYVWPPMPLSAVETVRFSMFYYSIYFNTCGKRRRIFFCLRQVDEPMQA